MSTEPQRRWAEAMAEAYDRYLVPTVFRPFAADLARRAARLAPAAVLELAAGTGVLTRELLAAAPGAEIVATDLNAPMVRLGERLVPDARWELADAERLPFPEARFDLVACQFGVMFFPEKPAAFAQARRVLIPGGRLLFNTWHTVESHDFARALLAGLRAVFPVDPPRFLAAVPHGYTDPERVVADLVGGGLEVESVETVTLAGRAASAADVALGFCVGTPLRAEIEARADLTAMTQAVQREVTARLGAGPVTGQMTAHVVVARRPAGP
jgi:SAM-dependent methyltransferase